MGVGPFGTVVTGAAAALSRPSRASAGCFTQSLCQDPGGRESYSTNASVLAFTSSQDTGAQVSTQTPLWFRSGFGALQTGVSQETGNGLEEIALDRLYVNDRWILQSL